MSTLRKCILILVSFLIATCNPLYGQNKNADQNWPEFSFPNGPSDEYPNGILATHNKLVDDAPFDVSQYYNIKNSDNREQVYLAVLAAMNPDFAKDYCFPTEAVNRQELLSRRKFIKQLSGVEKSYPRLEALMKRGGKGFRDNDAHLLETDEEKARKYLSEFDWVFETLVAAKERKLCFFHRSERRTNGFIRGSLRRLRKLIELKQVVEPKRDTVFDEVQAALLLSVDVRRFGNEYDQEAASRLEATCMEKVIRPLMADQPTSGELSRIIEILKDHEKSQLEIDPVIEQARNDYIWALDAVHALQEKRYLQMSRRGTVFVTETDGINFALVGLGWSPTGSTKYADLIEPRWESANRPQAEKQEFIQYAKFLRKTVIGKESLAIADQLVARIISQRDPKDYENDAAILRKRYQDIEASCQKPFPESTQALKKLTLAWTLDDSWKNSTAMVWLLPWHPARRASQIAVTRGYLCVAAVRSWQTEHEGENPPDLETALKSAGIAETPICPFSGKPFMYDLNDGDPVIYGLGPDGKDDGDRRGKASAFRYEHPRWLIGETEVEVLGDIVFRVDDSRDF